MSLKATEEMILNEAKERAEELGISLTEYLLIRVILKLDDLSVTTYSGD